MDRPYLETTIEDLEKIVDRHKSDRVVLAQVREELGFRKRKRAKQLLREVLGLLGGEVQCRRGHRGRTLPTTSYRLSTEA